MMHPLRLSIAAFSLFLFFAMPVSALQIPPNEGYVTDAADVLTLDQETKLQNLLRQYSQQTSNEIAIAILPELAGEPIADAAVTIGRKWGVGKAKQNNGVLILVGYKEQEVFIAPGYGLEATLPDLVVKGVIERDMIPMFREGDYAGGLEAGISSIMKHASGEFTESRYETDGSLGFFPWIIFLFFIVLNWFAASFAKTKSWWLGGIVGAVFGVILTVLFAWWWSIAALAVIGFAFDYIVSRNPGMVQNRRRRFPGGGGGFGGGGFGGGSGGGGGGFGGGSFGGGGAGGKW